MREKKRREEKAKGSHLRLVPSLLLLIIFFSESAFLLSDQGTCELGILHLTA